MEYSDNRPKPQNKSFSPVAQYSAPRTTENPAFLDDSAPKKGGQNPNFQARKQYPSVNIGD